MNANVTQAIVLSILILSIACCTVYEYKCNNDIKIKQLELQIEQEKNKK